MPDVVSVLMSAFRERYFIIYIFNAYMFEEIKMHECYVTADVNISY